MSGDYETLEINQPKISYFKVYAFGSQNRDFEGPGKIT